MKIVANCVKIVATAKYMIDFLASSVTSLSIALDINSGDVNSCNVILVMLFH
jgi:hypothetical protein